MYQGYKCLVVTYMKNQKENRDGLLESQKEY